MFNIRYLQLLIIFWGITIHTCLSQNPVLFTTTDGLISFTSDAPLELIKAETKKLTGALKTTDKSFYFNIQMITFSGFNSNLQRTHFNENYVESDKYPKSVFEGKIIEDIDFNVPGTYQIRAKGKLTIHDVTQQRIIKCQLIISKGSIKISSNFTIRLDEHNIKIPAVVNQKLAEEVSVKMEAELKPKK
jgi:polyisoprenoid-binding protein YceI